MFTATRLSKTTFFAAATLSLASSLFAQPIIEDDGEVISIKNSTNYTYNEDLIPINGFLSLHKSGEGVLELAKFDGTTLYNQHAYGFVNGRNNGAYISSQYSETGELIEEESEYNLNDDLLQNLLGWTSGELLVKEGILNLTGYVNAWVDLGPGFNVNIPNLDVPASGKMAGVTRVTIVGGAELSLDGGNNSSGGMVLDSNPTWFQFLHNLNAVDSEAIDSSTGKPFSAKSTRLDLGSSSGLSVGIHIDAWEENTRTETDEGMFDNSLAFGGSVGRISGVGNVYKTGAGTFEILTGSPDFKGSLYAGGGELVLSVKDTGISSVSFENSLGNTVRTQVYNGISSAESVNIAGTFVAGNDASNHGSRQPYFIASHERWADDYEAPGTFKVNTYVKESYFTTPEAATLVIAENQKIVNLQSDFNAGFQVATGTDVGTAIRDAAARAEAETALSAPMVVGTGVGSKIVIPGGIYKKDAAGNYTSEVITNVDGYMTGGVLVVEQKSGMGGVYEGAIVGCRVSIYAKDDLGTDGTNEERLAKALLSKDKLTLICRSLGGSVEDLGISDEDGSFALDNELAQKVVAHYKNAGSKYHIDYQADNTVVGGLLYLQGAGDLALLLEEANYSGICIDETRTGKTILNIAALNNVTGRVTNLGAGLVSIVATQFDTLNVKLEFAEGSRLVFSTVDELTTKSGVVRVGGSRQAITGVNYAVSVQDLIYGHVYVEHGSGLALTGDQSTFENAASVTLWKGRELAGEPEEDAPAASVLVFQSSAVQVLNNLTGDSTGQIELNSGTLVANITDNSTDAYSGLSFGSFNGKISGAGSVVKAGAGVLSLGGGENTRMFYGTTEVASGSLAITKAKGLTGSSALILNAGTSASMTGDQSIRNLFGSAETAVTVNGTLTLGSNDSLFNGEVRSQISSRLGTGDGSLRYDASSDASFKRFTGNFDKAGNLLEAPSGSKTQAEWTKEYLTYTAKLAYSGFDVSAMDVFVDSGVLDDAAYASLAEIAKNGARESTSVDIGGTTVGTAETLYADLVKVYGELSSRKLYADVFSINPADGYYSPVALKSILGATEYGDFIKNLPTEVAAKYGAAIPNNPTEEQKGEINRALYEVLCSKYDAAISEKLETVLDRAVAGNLTAEEAYSACKIVVVPDAPGTLIFPELPDFPQFSALWDAYKNKTVVAGDFLEPMRNAAWKVAAKDAIKGIGIVGAFANDVDSKGNLVNAEWVDDLAFSGTVTATVLQKTGDNTVTLNGTVNTSKIVVGAGTLATNYKSIAGTLIDAETGDLGKITISRGASFSLNVDSKEETLTYAVSGAGNFIKDGAGKLTLSSSVIYTGTTTLKGGTLQMVLRNPMALEDGTSLAGQGDIYLAGNHVQLVLDQNDDYTAVRWERGIETLTDENAARYSDVGISKIGDGELAIAGDVVLGADAVLAVESGILTLSGALSVGDTSEIAIEEGATLSVSSLLAGGSLRVTGSGALKTTGDVVLAGSMPLFGSFNGTVTVAAGTLTLSGESLFDYAREVLVSGGATLQVSSAQQVRRLSGLSNATVTVDDGASLTIIRDNGGRLALDFSSGNYIFNEEAFLDAPTYSGALTGAGIVMIDGVLGTQRFSGEISSKILVKDGSQLLLDVDSLVSGGLLSTEGSGSEVLFVGKGSLSDEVNGAFANGGIFGKVGAGMLTVDKSKTVLEGVSKIRVYSGELFLDEWVNVRKELAYGSKLSVNLEKGADLVLTEVLGSGTLELTTDSNTVSFSITGTNTTGSIQSLPTEDLSGNGEFFNGIISFSGAFDVTLRDVTLTSVNTSTDAKLTIGSGVTLVQSQNSVLGGEVVFGDAALTVKGSSDRAGYAFTPSSCSLIFAQQIDGSIQVSNVGIGFTDNSKLDLLIDPSSKANTFYVSKTTDGNKLVGKDISIDGADPSTPAAGYALEEISIIKTGNGKFTITAADIKTLGKGQDNVFGIGAGLYSALSEKKGTINLGVDEGKMVVSGLANVGTLSTANGIDVNLVTGRSADGSSVGTLVVDSTGATTNVLALTSGTKQILAESISGTGSVEFAGAAGTATVVTAAQAYTGQTLVSGEVEFSGAGRNNASSLVKVEGTLHGGVNLVGRGVGYAVAAERNANDAGDAGSLTLLATLTDSRLPANVTCALEVEADGTVSAANVLGALPAGISVVSQAYKDGAWTITLKDEAFNGEAYAVVIPVDSKTLPAGVGEKSQFSNVATVAGNVAVSSTGKVVLNAAAGDQISVGAGAVSFANGGSIVLQNLNEEVRGKAIGVVSAGSVTYGTSTTVGSAAVVEALKSGYVQGTSKLMVFTDAETGTICAQMVTDDFAALGVDYNDGISASFLDTLSEVATAGRSLDKGVLNADALPQNSAKDLLFALNSLTTNELAAEVNKLSPNSFASMLAMPVSAFNSDIARIHSRLDQRRYDGANPLRESDEYEFFALAQSDFAENDSASDSPIYDYNLYGVTAGFDWKPSFETTLGLALGYTYGKAKIHDGGGKINMDEMRATAFASHFFGDFYLEGGVQAGMAMFDTRRNTIAGAASGDTDSVFAGTFVTLGSVYVLDQDKKTGEGLYFTPSIGLSYFHSEIDGFRERGTSGLAMDDADGDSLRVRVAAGLQWEFFLSDVKMRLGAELAYAHDFLGEELDMDGRFSAGGSKFRTSGKALPTDIISFMPTLDIMLSEKSSVYLGYGVDFGTDSGISQNVNAGFRHRF